MKPLAYNLCEGCFACTTMRRHLTQHQLSRSISYNGFMKFSSQLYLYQERFGVDFLDGESHPILQVLFDHILKQELDYEEAS